MSAAVMRDVRGDGAPKGFLIVKRDKLSVLRNKRRMRSYGDAWKDF